LVLQNIGSLPTSRETFCDVFGHHFDTVDLEAANAFENICDIALVQVITDETNIHTLQEILKGVNPFTFHSRTGSGRCYSGQNGYGFCSLYIDEHCTEAYT
jgi:hypothetical protein